MNRKQFIQNMVASAAVAAPVAAGVSRFSALSAGPKQTAAPARKQESVYDRVLRTGEIRCGYLTYEPLFIKAPNTGQFSGIFYEMMEAIGKSLRLKVVWAEEGGVTNLVESLKTDRIDAVASGLWSNSARGRVIDFSQPIFFSVLGVYVRANENRFTDNLSVLDDPKVKIAVIDGEMADQITDSDFPKASKLSLPQLSDFSMLLLNVATGKADATIAATHEALAFLEANPNSIKKADVEQPIRVFPNVLFWKKNEPAFASMINSAIDELFYKGQLNKIISKYEPYPGSFSRAAKRYEKQLKIFAPFADLDSK